MSTNNPVAEIDNSGAAAVSKEQFCIAGLLTTVYGLEQLHADASQVGCLWLLHPRLQTQECMEPLARSMISDWNSRRTDDGTAGGDASSLGPVAVSFDQRNHGSRSVLPLANEAWRSGNRRHAQDMFSIYHGTAMDTSLLLDHLESYIFPSASRRIATNIVVGISLGGHAAWQCVVHEPRIKAAVVGIGCPDYIRLMSHRAAKSKLDSWITTTLEPGASFIGSADFPPTLVEAVQKWDPAGLLMNEQYASTDHSRRSNLNRETVERHLGGKSIFSQSGGVDKLVPYSCSQPFLAFLESIAASSTSSSGGGSKLIRLKDVVYADVAHEMTTEMLNDATAFVMQLLHEARTSVAR
ncbi:MAG: hypothetical protein M1815_004369 [Lichina confinis]|nr:MAG: hypothetical protein M1815_004369 [Lichina confinis]